MKFLNIVKRITLALFVVGSASLVMAFASHQPLQQTQKKKFIVVLDPGHGGQALGAVGRKSKEKDIVLDVSKKLKTELESRLPDVQVLLTRTTDINVAFKARTDLANKNHADLFISIHANSANSARKKNPHVKGTETLVLGFGRVGEQDVAVRENADMLLEENKSDVDDKLAGYDPNDPATFIIFKFLKNQYREQSIKLAALMQSEFSKSSRINRGVKEQGLAVLATAGMPAVLTEIGFISSPEEENFMLSNAGQTQIVENLFQAIKSYKTAVGK